jgi:rod shape-determining protein MreC
MAMRSGMRGSMVRVAAPVKALAQRFAFVLLVALALSLMILGRVHNQSVEPMRVAVVELAMPVLEGLSRPLETAETAVRDVGALMDIRDRNLILAEENDRLKRWEVMARRLEQENLALRGLLNVKTDHVAHTLTGRVIADSGGSFVRTMLVNVGVRDGVAKGHAAIGGEGLIGRVVEVGETYSRILLITDLNSRVPVVIESTRQRAILGGDNSESAILDFLPLDVTVEIGERIVTSGDGGTFPPGLPIGVVSAQQGGEYRVRPLVDLGRLDFVRLIAWTEPVVEPVEGQADLLVPPGLVLEPDVDNPPADQPAAVATPAPPPR